MEGDILAGRVVRSQSGHVFVDTDRGTAPLRRGRLKRERAKTDPRSSAIANVRTSDVEGRRTSPASLVRSASRVTPGARRLGR
jgi:hypothetical protein